MGITKILALSMISMTFGVQIVGEQIKHLFDIMLQKIIKTSQINSKCPCKVIEIKNQHQRSRSRELGDDKNGISNSHSYQVYSSVIGSQSSSDSSQDTFNFNFRKYQGPKHCSFHVGQWINGYKIINHLNDGTFGRVLEVEDENNVHYAMKIVQGVYIESAKIEVAIINDISLKQIETNQPDRIVQMFGSFNYGKYFCIIFEKLEINLDQKMKINNGFSIKELKYYLRQILEGLTLIHEKLKLVHTDLKPENIMLTKEGNVKLIDFGGATWDKDMCLHLINTRQYRAPEIILGSGKWSYPSDIWSLGCVALELYSGKLFFQTNSDDLEHLWLIENQCGLIPEYMVLNGCYKQYEWRQIQSEKLNNINSIIDSNHFLFNDLIRRMLCVDPRMRISASDALLHSFFN